MIIPSIGIIVVAVGALLGLLAVDWVVGGLAYASHDMHTQSMDAALINVKEAA